MKRVESGAADPGQRLRGLFRVLEEWFTGGEFNGCMFINASAEYANPTDPIHAAAAEHKRLVHKYVTRLATDAGAREPERLATELILLMEGATVWAQTTGDTSTGRAAGIAAEVLLNHAIPSGNPASRFGAAHAAS